MTDDQPRAMGSVHFMGAPPVAPQPQPQAVLPDELLAWGAGVRTDLTAIRETLTAIAELLHDQRDLLLSIASTTKASVLLAEREDAHDG